MYFTFVHVGFVMCCLQKHRHYQYILYKLVVTVADWQLILCIVGGFGDRAPRCFYMCRWSVVCVCVGVVRM